MSKQYHMLTTVDNPFNPITQFKEWYNFDTAHGYDSLQLLARMTYLSDSLSEETKTSIIEETIEEIVTENLSGMHTSILITEEN